MILVHDTKIINTYDKRKFHPIYHADTLGIYDGRGDEALDRTVEVKIEHVEGRRFRNNRGLEVVIGWDKATQIALGLPFKLFENMDRRRQQDYEENTILRKELREIKEMSVWQLIWRRLSRKW